MSFPNKIKSIRQTCLLSQEAFAKELGVSFATVNRWEAGKTRPTYKTLKLIRTFCIAHNINVTISTDDLEETHNV